MTTKLSFQYSQNDFFDKVKQWALENKYKIKQSSDSFMLLQRGSYLSWNAHPSLLVEKKGADIALEAWISPIWGGKMEITSDNVVGFAAKAAARNQINKLLEAFDQKPLI